MTLAGSALFETMHVLSTVERIRSFVTSHCSLSGTQSRSPSLSNSDFISLFLFLSLILEAVIFSLPCTFSSLSLPLPLPFPLRFILPPHFAGANTHLILIYSHTTRENSAPPHGGRTRFASCQSNVTRNDSRERMTSNCTLIFIMDLESSFSFCSKYSRELFIGLIDI